MITIDTDLVYQTKYYELNTRRTNLNAYASVDSYPEDYSTKNATDSASATEINTGDADLDAILQALKLYVPENRFSLLLKMSREDLLQMLFLLDKDNLALGLKFFSKDKLVDYVSNLSKEEILKIVGQLYSNEEILAMLPIKTLMKFMDNTNIEPSELLKVLKSLPTNVLAQIYEASTGESAGKMDYDQFIQEFQQINQRQIMEGCKSLPYKELLNIVNIFTENNPDLMKSFSSQTLCTPLLKSMKSEVIEGMKALDPEKLIKLVGQLPDKLLANIDTLLDPTVLSEYLLKNNKNLLASLAA